MKNFDSGQLSSCHYGGAYLRCLSVFFVGRCCSAGRVGGEQHTRPRPLLGLPEPRAGYGSCSRPVSSDAQSPK